MGGLYGKSAVELDNWLRGFGFTVSSNVRYWKNTRPTLAASICRSFAEYHYRADKLREELGVAKKIFENSSWKGFVNVSLTAEQKEAYASWDLEDADVWLGLATYGEKGYKFSLTWSDNNSNWVATYTGTESAAKNAGYAVSGFAGSPYDAARVLLFKVSAILPDTWKEFKPLPHDSIG
jgi:hypothetical protein